MYKFIFKYAFHPLFESGPSIYLLDILGYAQFNLGHWSLDAELYLASTPKDILEIKTFKKRKTNNNNIKNQAKPSRHSSDTTGLKLSRPTQWGFIAKVFATYTALCETWFSTCTLL